MTDMFVKAYRNGTLTEALAIQYSTDLYRVAYVTKAEDLRLTALGLRSKAFDTPEARWAAAGIEFLVPMSSIEDYASRIYPTAARTKNPEGREQLE